MSLEKEQRVKRRWECPKCGRLNDVDVRRCYSCGTFLDNSINEKAVERQRISVLSGSNVQTPPANPNDTATFPGEESIFCGRPRPWVRFWARSFDTLLLAYVPFFMVMLFPGKPIRLEKLYFFSCLALPLGLILEAVILAMAGTTPGKAILNIKLTDDKGLSVSFPEAIKRGWDIFYRGCAFGIYPVSLFTQAWQKRKLQRDGKTSWDERYGLKVTHHPIGASKIAGFTAAFLLLYLFVTIMSVAVTLATRETGMQSRQSGNKIGSSVDTTVQGEGLKGFNIDEWEPVESK